MQGRARDIERIQRELRSSEVRDRQRALEDLRQLASDEPSLSGDAADLYRGVCDREKDPWVLLTAVRGLETSAPKAETAEIKRRLIERPEPDVVAMALLNFDLKLSVGRLLEMYARADDYSLRNTLVHKLAHTRDERAFAILLQELDRPDMRPYAIEALVVFGDSRAIPQIERCLSDTSDAWPIDNHGPMMRVCDVASEAIARLRKSAARPAVPDRLAPAQPVPQARPAVGRPGLPGLPQWISSNPTLLACIPLGAAIFTVPWFLMFVIGVIGATGTAQQTPDRTRAMDFVAIIPPMIGLAMGIHTLVKRRVRDAARLSLLLFGCLSCVLVAWPFLAEARSITLAEKRETAGVTPAAPNPPPKRVPIPSGKPPPLEVRQPEMPKVEQRP